MSKIAESQRSFIYLELDELYFNSNLLEPQKQSIYQEFKLFLESVNDTSLLTEITDSIFELGVSEEDPFPDLLTLKNQLSDKQLMLKL
ncbi:MULTISPECIES: hypothetical protein [unclassified Mesobacillus]|uniref:hypothetical protein n=1 Tax=unclassified Mesobacillus TaxID=2675270 RepID=UPI00204041A1|nr:MULTISPECIES: hypothetical protein [unclassified Mesobacillus]MCM3123001.1 hypothetical protein [Mesobacillus sp. MER 33]MCM3233516.1 hypothetical protein [Mesobacillus sp. MER 48]